MRLEKFIQAADVLIEGDCNRGNNNNNKYFFLPYFSSPTADITEEKIWRRRALS